MSEVDAYIEGEDDKTNGFKESIGRGRECFKPCEKINEKNARKNNFNNKAGDRLVDYRPKEGVHFIEVPYFNISISKEKIKTIKEINKGKKTN